jgi:predicted dehydrogenase
MTVNIAMLGTGSIADDALAPALKRVAGANLWSVLSRDRERARAFAQRHGASAPAPAHDKLETLLSDPDLDAVIIATPDYQHAPQAVAAARAGKHVLTEKPMATSVEEGEAMVRACDDAGVKLAIGYHLRWHAGHRKMLALIRAGGVGELRHMRAQWTFQAPDAGNWRARRDTASWWSLSGVGTHCLDLIRWVMVPVCGEVVSLGSTISRDVWNGPNDETAVVSLRFASGATAEFCSSVLVAAPSRAEIYGSAGYIRCEDTLTRLGAGMIHTHEGRLEFDAADPYNGEIRDFVAAIEDHRKPEIDGREGLRNIELLDQAVASAGV